MLEINKNYVIDGNQQPVAVQNSIAEYEKISSALENLQENDEAPHDLDVEKDIVVRMQPLLRQRVKVKVKHLGRANPPGIN